MVLPKKKTRVSPRTTTARKSHKMAGTSPDRRRSIINEAAKLFARKGFDATSMRDIAAAVNITVGASYWYFRSKEELFSAVHAAGLKATRNAVLRAIEGHTDSWMRLQAAAEAHCEALLNPVDAIAVLIPPNLGTIRRQLIAHREQYERVFRGLVDALDLPKDVDRQVFRLQFLTGLNGTLTWYRMGGKYSPAEVARQFLRMLRRPARRAFPPKAATHPTVKHTPRKPRPA